VLSLLWHIIVNAPDIGVIACLSWSSDRNLKYFAAGRRGDQT